MINKKRLVQTFLELVKIDSPSGEEGNIAHEVEKRLKVLGGKVDFDSFGNLICKFSGQGEPLMLNAHLDTVEPGRGIKPIIKKDIIKSNGETILGADDKAGLAIILEAVSSLEESKISHRPLEVVLTLGEESGLFGAINLDYKKLRAKEGVTFDGHGPVSNVTIAAPGYNRVDVTIYGRAAHAGVEPEKGISAIVIASQIISQLKLGRIDEETTANIGLFEGGNARNAVPEKAHFKGEIRSRHEGKLESHTEHFRSVFNEVIAQYPDSQIELSITKEFGPYRFSQDHNTIRLIVGVFNKMGIKPNFEESGGGSDVNIFNDHGLDIVDVGTGVRDMHTRSEHLIIDEFVQAAEFARELHIKIE